VPPEELLLTLRAKRSAWISYRDRMSELPYSSVYRLIATHRDAVGADPKEAPDDRAENKTEDCNCTNRKHMAPRRYDSANR